MEKNMHFKNFGVASVLFLILFGALGCTGYRYDLGTVHRIPIRQPRLELPQAPQYCTFSGDLRRGANSAVAPAKSPPQRIS